MAKKSNGFNVDEAFERLNQINERLADKEVSLSESLTLYKEGVELAAKCREHLVGVETQLKEIESQQ